MYYVISIIVDLRVSSMHVQRGLDITEYGEIGYPEFGNDAAYSSENLKDLNKL
jgi:Amt family ammonium transporter